jgi:hypothetical protein
MLSGTLHGLTSCRSPCYLRGRSCPSVVGYTGNKGTYFLFENISVIQTPVGNRLNFALARIATRLALKLGQKGRIIRAIWHQLTFRLKEMNMRWQTSVDDSLKPFPSLLVLSVFHYSCIHQTGLTSSHSPQTYFPDP